MSASGDPDPEVDKPVITTVRVETSRVKGAQPRGRLVRSLSFGGPYRSGRVPPFSGFPVDPFLVCLRQLRTPYMAQRVYMVDMSSSPRCPGDCFMRPFSLVAKCLAI